MKNIHSSDNTASRHKNRNMYSCRSGFFYKESGITFMAVLMMVTVMGIMSSIAGRYWSTMVKREKEAELLFRGDQIRKGIERYHKSTAQKHGGSGLYPESMQEMIKSRFSLVASRTLRKIYKDPITGDEWVLITDPVSKGIMGVRSQSEAEPLKTSNFTFNYRDFEGKTKYSDWTFVYLAQKPAGTKLP